MSEAKVWQPLHPDILPRLDPEYAAFHTANFLHTPASHQLPWDPAIRSRPGVPGMTSDPEEVGSIRDFALSKFNVRVFTPKGDAPAEGWPVFIFFHGGGWTLGGIDTENSFCTIITNRAKCISIAVDYRLAPENRYPAAVEDSVETLEWVYNSGKAELNANINKIAVGGSSSGGNLAAIVAHKAHLRAPPIPLVLQLLVVPVTDNTAELSGHPHASWLENANTPWLNTDRMVWFRNQYIPNKGDYAKWDASPLLAPDEWFSKVPKAWIGVTELDILKDEGLAYGEKMKKAGVDVEVVNYEAAPHPIMAMDGALKVGKRMVADAANALTRAFNTV